MKYIDKLNDKEWNDILKGSGYRLDIENESGSPRPYVDKGEDEPDYDVQNYLLRVINTSDETKLMKSLYYSIGFPISLMTQGYDDFSNDIIIVDDYNIRSMKSMSCLADEDVNVGLQRDFVNYLSKKFPGYADDYNSYVDSLFLDNEM